MPPTTPKVDGARDRVSFALRNIAGVDRGGRAMTKGNAGDPFEPPSGGITQPTPAGVAMVETAQAMLPELRAAQEEIDQGQRVPERFLKQLAGAGFFRALGPDEIGGGQADYVSFFRAVEELGRGAGSVGWCVLVNGAATNLATFLDLDGAREVFADELTVVAGSPGPRQGTKAIEVEGGYRVWGRWRFASNSRHATHFIGGFLVHDDLDGPPRSRPDGRPDMRTAYFRADQVEVVDDSWDTIGLRGTHSGDFVVSDVFVPHHWTLSILDGPRLTNIQPVNAAGHAIVGLGIARHALEAFVELAGTKEVSAMGAPAGSLIGERAVIQAELGRVESEVRAARAWMYQVLHEGWARAVAGQPIDPAFRTVSQLMEAHVAEVCRSAVQKLCALAATTAVFRQSDLARCLGDVTTMAAHRGVQEIWYERGGKTLLGFDEGLPVGTVPTVAAFL